MNSVSSKENIFRFFTLFILIVTLLFIPTINLYAKTVSIPEFEIQFDQNDPYEIVLTAEKYRQAFLDENVPEKEWRIIFYEKAMGLYEKAFTLDPTFHYAYLSYGYTQLKAAEVFKKREPYYSLAWKAVPKMYKEDPFVYQIKGQLHCLSTKEWDQADYYLGKSTKLANNNSSAYAWLGYTLGAEELDIKAQTAYRMAIKANSDKETVLWAKKQIGDTGKPRRFPPIVVPTPPRCAIQPVSTKMRLQINQFVDNTQLMGDAAIMFSRLLATTLFKSPRFDLIDTQEKQFEVQKKTWDSDAVLTGSIVRVVPSENQFVLDMKVFNPTTGNMLFAEMTPIAFTKQGDSYQVDDKEVEKIADMITRQLVKGEGRLVFIDGRKLLIDLGAESGVKSGRTGIVLITGERMTKNALTGDVLTRDIYLGEVIFERVEDKFSSARLITPGRVFVRVGDIVRLK